MFVRLQKYLADCNIGSRRKCEQHILDGKVKVNDKCITELGVRVTKGDIVKFNDEIVFPEKKRIYIMLNKPIGYVTTVNDQFGRDTVLNLISDVEERIYPVGRLDYNTSGLLLLTNDGDFTLKITHPKHKLSKKYIVTVYGVPTNDKLKKFSEGLTIEGYKTAKAFIKILKKNNDGCDLEVTINEGKNRQVRKMCEEIGHKVKKLRRVAIGNLEIGNIKIGEYRYLTENEVKDLKGGF